MRRALPRALHRGGVIVLLLAGTGLAALALWAQVQSSDSGGTVAALLFGVLVAAGLCSVGAHVRRWRKGSRPARSGLPWRIALYVLVGGTGGYVLLFQPYDPRSLTDYWGVVGGFFPVLAWIALAARAQRARLARTLKVLDLVAFNLCLGLVVLELSLRVLAETSSSPIFERTNGVVRERIARYRLTPGEKVWGFPVNSRGFYDHEYSPQEGRILVTNIGDSFGVGIVPHSRNYQTVAEALLSDVEIYNVSVPGVGPAEYVHLLSTEALPLKPDLVLVGLFVGNDITEARRIRDDDTLGRRWFDRGNVMSLLIPKRLIRMAGANLDRLDFGRDEVSEVQPRYLDDPFLEKPTHDRETLLEIQLQLARRNYRPDDLRGYADTFLALERMKAACGETPMLVLVFPDQFQIDDDLWGELVAKHFAGVSLDRDQPQRIVGEWLAAQGIPCLDLLPVFRAVPALKDGKRHLYHAGNTHLNARGNRIAGEALADFLRSRL